MRTAIERARAIQAARVGELTNIQIYLTTPDVTLDDVRTYVAERIEGVLPIDYHVYRQQWQCLADEVKPGPLLPFLAAAPLEAGLAFRFSPSFPREIRSRCVEPKFVSDPDGAPYTRDARKPAASAPSAVAKHSSGIVWW